MSTISHAIDLQMGFPINSIESYTSSVKQIPILTAEEERELGRQLREETDLAAAQKLIMSHLRFVVHIARGYNGYGLPQADLIQEGNVGLMKAVKRFDIDHNVRLVSFAVHWIRAEIHEYILKNWRIVKVATTKAQRKLFFNLRRSKKRLGWFSHEEVNRVAEDLGVSPKEVLEMESRLSGQDIGFDGGPDSDDSDSVAVAPANYLCDTTFEPSAQVEQKQWSDRSHDRLHRAMKNLDDRSNDIISSRWLTDQKMTLQQLADRYEISAERVRQLEKIALGKLKNVLVV